MEINLLFHEHDNLNCRRLWSWTILVHKLAYFDHEHHVCIIAFLGHKSSFLWRLLALRLKVPHDATIMTLDLALIELLLLRRAITGVLLMLFLWRTILTSVSARA